MRTRFCLQFLFFLGYTFLLLHLLRQSSRLVELASGLVDRLNSSSSSETVETAVSVARFQVVTDNHSNNANFSTPLPVRLRPWSVNCSGQTVAVVLKSRPEEYYQRMAVRRTWGSAYRRRLVFVIGRSASKELAVTLNSALRFEWEQHGDILLVDFVDSYYNLSLKTLACLRWLAEECRGPSFFLHGDTDALIYPENVEEFVRRRVGTTKTIYGKCWKGARVMRSGKWQTSYLRYVSAHYPDYCAGAATLMTSDVPARLLGALDLRQTYFPIDDVFFTGILAEKSQVRRVSSPGFYLLRELAAMKNCECMRLLATFEHGSPKLLTEAWKQFRLALKDCDV